MDTAKAAWDAVKRLSVDVGIPVDLDSLAESAFVDACRPGNPCGASMEEIRELDKKLLSFPQQIASPGLPEEALDVRRSLLL